MIVIHNISPVCIGYDYATNYPCKKTKKKDVSKKGAFLQVYLLQGETEYKQTCYYLCQDFDEY